MHTYVTGVVARVTSRSRTLAVHAPAGCHYVCARDSNRQLLVRVLIAGTGEDKFDTLSDTDAIPARLRRIIRPENVTKITTFTLSSVSRYNQWIPVIQNHQLTGPVNARWGWVPSPITPMTNAGSPRLSMRRRD